MMKQKRMEMVKYECDICGLQTEWNAVEREPWERLSGEGWKAKRFQSSTLIICPGHGTVKEDYDAAEDDS